MYRSQLLLLVYNQTLVGKKNKYDGQILELEKKAEKLGCPVVSLKSPKQKKASLMKKLDALPSKNIAKKSLNFLEEFNNS